MVSSFNKAPQVVVTNPRNYATDIATTINKITIGFNTDLDVNHITGNIQLKTKHGEHVHTKIEYQYRTVTLSFDQELEPNTTYTVHTAGDSNLNDSEVTGIRNVFGTPMSGIHMFSFTTEKLETLKAPEIIYPLDETLIQSKPVFSWNPVENGVKYELQISKSNTMTPIIWPIDPEPQFITTTDIEPNIPFRDAVYYWRVRAINSNGDKGDWTKICTFTVDTQKEGPVAEEDTIPPESQIPYDAILYQNDVEVIEAFPGSEFSNVKTNLQTIYFHVLGEVNASDVELSVIGESIFGEEDDHGTVSGTIEVIPQDNGTTIIAFTPDPITTQ